MRRRAFIAGAGAAAAWPVVAQAQAPGNRPIIGFLTSALTPYLLSEFVDGMRGLGYVESRDFDIVLRDGEGHSDRLPSLAEELAQAKPSVIVVQNSATAIAAHKSAPSTPIIALSMVDPVGFGLAASEARPGGMVTGLLVAPEGLSAKQLELALELVPGATRVGELVNLSNPGNDIQRHEIEAAARSVTMIAAEVRTDGDFDAAFAKLATERAQVLIVLRDTMFSSEASQIAQLALSGRLPMVSGLRTQVEVGGLLNYGTDAHANARYLATFVDKILKGAKPGDLPIEFPKLEMVLNMKTAKALGIAIPQSILIRVDQVIE